VKKFFKLLGNIGLGLFILVVGGFFVTCLVVIRVVCHVLERILYYPHLVVGAIANGSASLLKFFVTGYETEAAKKRKEKRGVVVGGVGPWAPEAKRPS
jgi:hypothetical protein